MKQQDIHNLIERFLDAETTLREEQVLMEYFRREDIPEDLMQYREMFLDYGEIQEPKQPPRINWVWAAAASLAVLFVFGIGFLYNDKEEEKPHVAQVSPKPIEVKDTKPETEEKQIAVAEAPSVPKTRNSKPKQSVKEENKESETILAETQGATMDAPQGNTFSYSVSNPERLKYTPEEIAALKRQARRKYEEWLQLELEIIEYENKNLSALINEVEQ